MKNDLLSLIKNLEVTPPENTELIQKYLRSKKTITFFSWKFPRVVWSRNRFQIDANFRYYEANKFSYKERQLLKILRKERINFRYLKIIPDDVFVKVLELNQYEKELQLFQNGVKKFFSKMIKKVEVVRLTDLIRNQKLQKKYNQVFQKIIESFDASYNSPLIRKKEFLSEVITRSKLYNLETRQVTLSKTLAQKAFAIFAAETYLLSKLSESNPFSNLILLAGARSTNTYKYEFFRFPKNRPVLPKLFVI